MVMPVTGPFNETLITAGPMTSFGWAPNWRSKTRDWYRQRRPYNLQLNYSLSDRRVLKSSNTWTNARDYGGAPSAFDSVTSTNAYNKAYSKFRENVGNSAALAVSLAERKQAIAMIATRGLQLYRFTRALKSFRFQEAANVLAIPHADTAVKRLNLRRNSKSFANNYLEFHFGWSPLVADIGSAVDVLQGGVPPCFAYGKGKSSRKFKGAGADPPNWFSNDFTVETKWKIGAKIRVNNPNLWLANSLGFVNPATVIWELVPFSFVVDWFVNVGDFLSSFTDFWGVDIIDPFSTRFSLATREEAYYTGFTCSYRSIEVNRTNTPVSGPKLRIREPWVLKPRRGLAAISLLVQSLKK